MAENPKIAYNSRTRRQSLLNMSNKSRHKKESETLFGSKLDRAFVCQGIGWSIVIEIADIMIKQF